MAVSTAASRAQRLAWWTEARFGMFVHWGLYAQLGRHEWAMNRERIPRQEYERLADSWQPKPCPAREWAALAKAAGMKYMVMTTKHHEGFCLWNSQQTDYNAVRRGPGRDLVQEYVDACRDVGLKIGFYYSLMDWHHVDGVRCAHEEKARRRFVDYTHGCVHELCSNYGPIDILWYDVAWPLATPELWESRRLNRMVRDLQPHILINNRSLLHEDFGTPEEHIKAEKKGRAWEACMTFNGSWGYMPYAPASDWRSPREVIGMLRTATAGQGNLLLNIGPKPDGSVPDEAVPRLHAVGQWLQRHGEAVYGAVDRAERFEWMPVGQWTRQGNTAYFWCSRWPGREIVIGGFHGKVKRASIVGDATAVSVVQKGERLRLSGLPERSPDPVANVAVIKLECASQPWQKLGAGCELL